MQVKSMMDAPQRSAWQRAFFETITGISLCIFVVGFGFVPSELGRLRNAPHEHAMHCAPLPQGNAVVALVASLDKQEAAATHGHSLRWLSLGESALTARIVF